MSRKRALTDDQCKDLANWYSTRMSMEAKAKELGISVSALYDAINRGSLLNVPRGTNESEAIPQVA
jgi:predicted DNA-binding protein YlxM (UPF0122 family)